MKIYSWNVNGLRAVLNKNALQEFLQNENPDIVCLQEIKCKPEQIDFDFEKIGYNIFYDSAKKPGYSGTATLVKLGIKTKLTTIDLGEQDFAELATNEGRIQILEFENFYCINTYVPNSKPDLSRLKLRELLWDPNLLKLVKKLEEEKPVIICGDFNAAHTEQDIARPKTNHHSAGFTDEERQGITNYLNAGLIDTFRSTHPNEQRYTWWSHWGHARENNIGWRIDYFFISKSIKNTLLDADIFENYMGSDHCPIKIELEF